MSLTLWTCLLLTASADPKPEPLWPKEPPGPVWVETERQGFVVSADGSTLAYLGGTTVDRVVVFDLRKVWPDGPKPR